VGGGGRGGGSCAARRAAGGGGGLRGGGARRRGGGAAPARGRARRGGAAAQGRARRGGRRGRGGGARRAPRRRAAVRGVRAGAGPAAAGEGELFHIEKGGEFREKDLSLKFRPIEELKKARKVVELSAVQATLYHGAETRPVTPTCRGIDHWLACVLAGQAMALLRRDANTIAKVLQDRVEIL